MEDVVDDESTQVILEEHNRLRQSLANGKVAFIAIFNAVFVIVFIAVFFVSFLLTAVVTNATNV